jgi:hypothetical protein
MRNRILFALSFLAYMPFAQAQQPAKFKTANQAQEDDSVYRATTPQVKETLPVLKKTNPKDTAVWGALATLGLVFVIPQGELSDITIQGFGYGFQSSLLINPAKRRNPFAWERRKANVYLGGGVGYLKQGGIKDIYTKTVDSSTKDVTSLIINTAWTFDVIGRFEVLKGPIKLFVEGSWGGSLFAAKQTLEYDELTLTAPDTYRVTHVLQITGADREWIGHYAYGGGFRTGTELFKLEFKIMNHIGQNVSYIDIRTVGYNNSTKELTYSVRKMSSNYWLPQVTGSYFF